MLSSSNSASELIVDGWFNEVEALWPGQRMSLKVKEVLLNGKSSFQDFLLFESESFGKVLVLDGVIQLTERDEFTYQEMITHLPLFSVPNPKRVLIIGGGDCCVLREVCKHSSVEVIHMCEIDEQVVEVSKKHFNNILNNCYNDPRVTFFMQDANLYVSDLAQQNNDPNSTNKFYYDCIICDSSDPISIANSLFTKSFYSNLNSILTKDIGVICVQAECQFLHLDLISKLKSDCQTIFPIVKYAYTAIPTYPCGQIGFLLMTNNLHFTTVPSKSVVDALGQGSDSLKYYSEDIHNAAFVLPAFARKVLQDS